MKSGITSKKNPAMTAVELDAWQNFKRRVNHWKTEKVDLIVYVIVK